MKKTSQPTYSLAAVKKVIQKASLDEVKAMLSIVRMEQKSYKLHEFNVVILLISYRLVGLSQQIRKKHVSQYVNDNQKFSHYGEEKIYIAPHCLN